MKHHVFMRKAIYTIINSAIKGMYNDNRPHPLNQECMGDWMEEDMESIHKVMHRLHEDMFSVSHTEIKETSDKAWDLILKNFDNCGIYRLKYNYYSWQMENQEEAIFHTKMADNIYNNMFSIATDWYNMYIDVTQDDACYTDEEILEEIATFVKNATHLHFGLVKGFKGKWDESLKMEHHNFSAMKKEVKQIYRENPNNVEHRCPMKDLWGKFMGDVTPEDMIGQIFGTFNPFTPVHHSSSHHRKQHHQSAAFPFNMIP